MNSRDLSIPIYLNQKIVFDLLAIVEDGFSQFRAVKTSEADARANMTDVGGQLGISNVFAFLGIGLKSSHEREKSSSSQTEISEERVFTPSSLFSKLRKTLMSEKLLINLDDGTNGSNPPVGSFVEFSAVLQKNPLIEALEAMVQIVQTAAVFDQSGEQTPNQPRKGNARAQGASKKPKAQTMVSQIESMIASLAQGNTIDLLASVVDGRLQAVVPVDLAYFVDKTPAAIIDGQFVVLGKVVRVVSEDDEGSINLLRGTSWGRLDPTLLQQLGAFTESFRSSGVEMPAVVTRVTGPAIQVVPVAIYI